MVSRREALAEALDAWRLAEHALARSSGPHRAELELETQRLRDEFQRLSAAVSEPGPAGDDELSRPPS